MIRPENHRYAVARGIRRLRVSFSEKYRSAFNVSLDPELECCVTMGSKDATFHLLYSLKRSGGRILLASPTYPIHRSAAHLSECPVEYFEISRDEERTFERIESKIYDGKPTVLLLNFPNNPTGVTVSPRFWEKIRSLREQYPVVVINDFTYGEMAFQGSAASLLDGAAERSGLVEMYSMSKAYSVPGWRVGCVVGDEHIVGTLSKLKAQLDYGNFLPIQIAASYGLAEREKDLVAPLRREYFRRSKAVITGLTSKGWNVSPPQAGACVWARIPESHRSLGSEKFCERLLLSSGISLLPGRVFGDAFNEFIRFALVAPESVMAEILNHMPSEENSGSVEEGRGLESSINA